MKLYTKFGDLGKTSLIGDVASKSSIRVNTYGEVDELSAYLCMIVSIKHDDLIISIINELFSVSYDLALVNSQDYKINQTHITNLENQIDLYQTKLDNFDYFIIPVGNELSSYYNIARTVCRRAERSVVLLSEHETINPYCIIYLNRLSDLLYIITCTIINEQKKALLKVTF